MRKLVALLVGALMVIAVGLASPALAQAESIEVSYSANPTQDIALHVYVSGVADGAHKLYVYVKEGEGECPSSLTPLSFYEGTALVEGETLGAGAFSKEYAYTPPAARAYTICAYLDASYYETVDALGYAHFTAGRPYGSLSVTLGATTTENSPVTITISGSSEASLNLYWYVQRSSECSSTPPSQAGLPEEPLNAGSFSKEYSYTPTPDVPATYIVCAYIDEAVAQVPIAMGSVTFTNKTPQERAEQEAAAKKKYEEEAPAREAAAIAAAKAQAHKTPVTHLAVKTVPHSRRSSIDPGYTNIDITTSPYAYVVVKLWRYGHSTEHFEWGSHSTEVAEIIRWSCRSPSGIYHYVVEAKSGVGPTLTRKGHFVPVSAARCHALKHEEAEARKRSEREAAQERRRVEDEERERLEIYEANCRTEGGTPITLFVEGRAERYCRAPQGGLLPVPH